MISLSTTPGGSPVSRWWSAVCSESIGISRAPVASASAVTSSPPTTSDSLLASATSMPSVSATIVGPRPAEPTIALSTRSAPRLGDEADQALGAAQDLALRPLLGGAGGGVRVAERDPRHAVLGGLRDQRVWPRAGGQPDDLEGVPGRA